MNELPNGVTFFERGWLSSNNVLIQDADQAVLVDTGYWTHAIQTSSLVASVLNDQPLTAVVNTHLHSDHCGGNAYLQSLYPSLRTYIPPGLAAFVDDWDADALIYTATGQHCPSFSRTGVFADGDTFLIGNSNWRAYSAPGHDPHSIVIFQEEDGILISADALWENGFGVVFPEIEGVDAFDEVEATLEIIQQLKPKIVLPGHGAAFNDVKGALIRAKSRLAQFRGSAEKHATYAAKVLLKFKLLDVQKIKYLDLCAWASSAGYLQLLKKTYANKSEFDVWVLELCKSLEKNGACLIDSQYIININ